MHIHVFRWGPCYDESYEFLPMEFKRDKVCRCGKVKKTRLFTWDSGAHTLEL